MARPLAGEPSANHPPAAVQTPPNGLAPVSGAAPLNYAGKPHLPGTASGTAPTPAGLWNAFRRRWVLGTFLGLLFGTAAAVGVWMLLPAGKHEVSAVVELRPRGDAGFVKTNSEDQNNFARQQAYLLRARDLLTRTISDPAIGSLAFVKGSEEPVTMLSERIKVEVRTPELLELRLTGNDLDGMKAFTDNHVRRFVDEASGHERRVLTEEIEKLEQQAATLKFEIESTEKQIMLLAQGNGTIGGEDSAKLLASLHIRRNELDSLFNRTGHELINLNARLDVVRLHLNDKGPPVDPDPAIVKEFVDADSGVQKLRDLVGMKKAAYAKALEIAGGNKDVPIVMEAAADLKKAEELLAEAEKVVVVVAIDRARARKLAERTKEAKTLADEIATKTKAREGFKLERDGLDKVIKANAGGNVGIDQMKQALQPQRDLLAQVNSHLTGLRFRAKSPTRVQLRGEAEKIPNNNQNKKILFASVGGLGAFFGVLLLVALLEWRTRRVDSVDQVMTELGMRVIGTVPVFPNRASLKAAVEAGGANWRFVLNESVNSARTMLLHTARSQSMQVVMITSATQGEGKTSLSAQLATSMATAGMRTLIVDCDLRNPCIQKLFELPLGPGVSEVLRQEIDVSDAVQATTVPNLWVIPAGQCSNATIAALAQGHPLQTLFNRLRGQFDFVIVDSCPVLPVADALLIGQHVDGVVFSIMQDVSQLPKVQTAQEKLGHLNVVLLGAVVNGIKQDVYSYGYNYVKQLPA
jgi:polysaccharide biosynthesis transport protein